MTVIDHAGEDCPICAKHRGEGCLVGGPLIWQDEHALVFHRPPDGTGRVFLGHLFIETRRHVAYVDQLTDTEATAVAVKPAVPAGPAVVTTCTAAPSWLIASRNCAGSIVAMCSALTASKEPIIASSGRWSNQLMR